MENVYVEPELEWSLHVGPHAVVAVEVVEVEEEGDGTLVAVIIVAVPVEVEETAAQDAGDLAQDQDHLREGREDQDPAHDPAANPGTEHDATDLHQMSARDLPKEDLNLRNEKSQQKNVQLLLRDDQGRGPSLTTSMQRRRGHALVPEVGLDPALEMTITKMMTRTNDSSNLHENISQDCLQLMLF